MSSAGVWWLDLGHRIQASRYHWVTRASHPDFGARTDPSSNSNVVVQLSLLEFSMSQMSHS